MRKIKIDDCCKRNFESMESNLENKDSLERINILKKFKKGNTIDVGSGGFMPFVLGTEYACDKSKLAGEYLRGLGWKGEFKVVDCSKKLPYSDKHFETVICSEVIEHFKKEEEVISIFKEIDRISNRWIVTTPSIFIPDRDHHFYFGLGTIYKFIPFEKDYFNVIQKGKTIYISNENLKEVID